MTFDDASNDHLGSIADSFIQRYRRGERPSITEYAEQYPDLAEEIQDVLPTLVMLEEAKAVEPEVTPVATALAEKMPSRLGDYQIRRVIGHGGMGVVYEAVQESLGRTVALKVLPTAAQLNPKTLQRFERESQAASRLHHSNIVPVYGVGHDDDVHYFVMQYLRGEGLDRVISELSQMSGGQTRGDDSTGADSVQETEGGHSSATDIARSLMSGRFRHSASDHESSDPSATDRHTSRSSPITSSASLPRGYWHSVARVGIQVGDALDYAHHQGTVHRDIKPSNLLLDDEGTTWITDFGLAKADDERDLTETGDLLGTLRYMAPEAFGGTYDGRSDIYSLGLTLYELAALKPARETSRRSELMKLARDGTVPPLRRVNPGAPRDLATIIHKAIDPHPDRRYLNAGELAEDLRRFERDEPIRARRVGLAERAYRWCRRNPAISMVSASAAAIVVLTASIAFAMVTQSLNEEKRLHGLAIEAKADAETAAEAAKTSADATGAIVDFLVLDMLTSSQAERSPGHDLTVGQMLFRAELMVGTRFKDHPEQEAAVRDAMAKTYYALGDYDLSHKHAQTALTLRRQAFGDDHLDTLKSMATLGNSHFGLGNYADAQKLLETSLAKLEDNRRVEQKLILEVRSNLAVSLHARGRYLEAEKLFSVTLEEKRKQLGDQDPSTLITMTNLAATLNALGRHTQAKDLGERTFMIKRKKLGSDHPSTLKSMGALANTRDYLEEYANAQALHHLIIRTRTTVLGGGHPDTLMSQANLADSLAREGRLAEAQEMFASMADAFEEKLGEEHPGTITTRANLATVLHKQGEFEQAIVLYRKVLPLAEEKLNKKHPKTLTIREGLGESLLANEQPADAEPCFRKVHEQLKVALGDDSPKTQKIARRLATVLKKLGRHDEAAQLGGGPPK